MIPSACPLGHSPSHIGLDPLWAQARGSGHPGRVPRRRRRAAPPPELLRERPPAGAGLPRRRRELPLDRLHGDPLPADADARDPDPRRRARPLPAPEDRRDRAGRVLAAGLDAHPRLGATRRSARTRSACRSSRYARASSCAARCASRPTPPRTSAGSSRTPARRCASSAPTTPTSRAAATRCAASRRASTASRERAKQRFYCDNFVDLMGAGLPAELRRARRRREGPARDLSALDFVFETGRDPSRARL